MGRKKEVCGSCGGNGCNACDETGEVDAGTRDDLWRDEENDKAFQPHL